MCGPQGPNTPHLDSTHLHFLFIIPHLVCAVFAPHPSPLSPFSTLPLLSSFPLLPSGLSSLCSPSVSASDELEGQVSPPPLWTWGRETTAVVYIYFFSIVVVIIIINIIATEQLTQMGSGRRLQRQEEEQHVKGQAWPPPRRNNRNGFILTLL